MTPPGGPVPISAPGLIGPNSILNPPWSSTGSAHKRSSTSFRHAHLEIDLEAKRPHHQGEPLLERLAHLLEERDIVEGSDLVVLAAHALHALASRRFRRVDHWEVAPGGWLPPPHAGKAPDHAGEPVGMLLDALEGKHALALTEATSFSARLSDLHGNHADLVIRRVHRKKKHALSVDLWGTWNKATIADLVGALKERLPVEHVDVTRVQYAPRK